MDKHEGMYTGSGSWKRHYPIPYNESERHTSGYDEQVEDFVKTKDAWKGIRPFARIDDRTNGIEDTPKKKQSDSRPWYNG